MVGEKGKDTYSEEGNKYKGRYHSMVGGIPRVKLMDVWRGKNTSTTNPKRQNSQLIQKDKSQTRYIPFDNKNDL